MASELNDSAYTVGVPEGTDTALAAEEEYPVAGLKYYSRETDALDTIYRTYTALMVREESSQA